MDSWSLDGFSSDYLRDKLLIDENNLSFLLDAGFHGLLVHLSSNSHIMRKQIKV